MQNFFFRDHLKFNVSIRHVEFTTMALELLLFWIALLRAPVKIFK